MKVNLKTERGFEKFNEFKNEMKSLGYDDIVVKNLLSPYKTGKSGFWIKIFDSDSFR
jgi:ATP-dependent DNA ligase